MKWFFLVLFLSIEAILLSKGKMTVTKDEFKPKEERRIAGIPPHSPEDSLITHKIIWVFVIVFILTIGLFLILKFSIDLANASKVELIKMKDAYSRLITEQLLRLNNPKVVID